MDNNLLLGLLQNGAILVAMSMVYDFFWVSKTVYSKVIIGIIVGFTTVVLMLSPWIYIPGITFDTRSIILGISGLFFGPIPTIIAMLCAVVVRFYIGGGGLYMGLAVIISSGLFGIVWGIIRKKFNINKIFYELLLLGIIIHVAMISFTTLLPDKNETFVRDKIFWPILIFYPILFVLLGLLMTRKRNNLYFNDRISRSETIFRGMAEVAKEGIAVIKNDKIIYINDSIIEIIQLSRAEFIGRSKSEIESIIMAGIKIDTSTTSIQNFETTIIDSKGISKIIEVNVNSVKLKNDQFEFVSVRDLTKKKETERALNSLNKRNERYLSTAMDGFLVVGSDFKIIDVNSTYCNISGYTKEELIGMPITNLDSIDDRNTSFERMSNIRKEGFSRFECNHIKKDGKIWPVEVNSRYLEMEGSIIVSFIKDLSNINIARKELEASEERYKNLVENSPDGIIIQTDSIITFANKAASSILGYDKPSRLLGKSIEDLAFSNLVNEVGKENSHYNLIEKCVKNNGEIAELDVWVSPMKSISKNTKLLIFRDLTENFKTLQKLTEIQERFMLAFDTSPDSININRLSDGLYLEVNQGFLELTGFSRDETIGKTSVELNIWVNPRDREALAEGLKKNGKVMNLEADFRAKNGSIIHGLMSASIISIDNEPHIISITRNISELREKELKIRELNDFLEKRVADRTAELENLNRDLESFSYSISHDLKAPLRHITGFAKILAEKENQDSETKGIINTIIASSNRMSAMIESLINFSKLGRKEIVRTKINTSKMVEDIIKNLEIETKDRKIEWNISNLPEIDADPRLINNAFENLIGNAIKFSSKKELTQIEISFLLENKSVIFTISDNGAGFDMKYGGKLFNVFQRMHKEEDFPGTGIGLANVKKIIDKHGGKIWLESEVNVGTKVYIRLPI